MTKPLPRTHGDRLGRHRNDGNHPPKRAYCRDPLGRPGLSPGTTQKHCCVLPGPRKRVQGPRSPAGRARVTLAYQTCHLCKIYPYGILVLAGKAGRHLASPRRQEWEILLWVLHVGLLAGESSQRDTYLQHRCVGRDTGLLTGKPPPGCQEQSPRGSWGKAKDHSQFLQRFWVFLINGQQE